MAAQRIVLTSPWKLGLFVFLLVVGTGFGLIYAYLEFFGGDIDLNDEAQLQSAYIILGCVAGLGLWGYLAVVVNARPIDRVVRGSRRRDQLIKRCGGIEDPRNVDMSDFEGETQLSALLQRWAKDAQAANDAQLLVTSQRESIQGLTAQLRGKESDLYLSDEDTTPDLGALVQAILEYTREMTMAAPAEPTAATSSSEFSGADSRILEAAAGLARGEKELTEFVTSVAESAAALSERVQDLSSSSGTDSTPDAAFETARRNMEKLAEIRQTFETLAEEANKLAITMALQLSRVGDAGNEMMETAEGLRSLSTQYQRLATDLRIVENEQVAAIERLGQGSSSSGPIDSAAASAMQQQAMVLDQNAGALRELLSSLHGPLTELRNWSSDSPVSEPRIVASDGPESISSEQVQSASKNEPEVAEIALTSPMIEPMTDEEDVYDMVDLGGSEVVSMNAGSTSDEDEEIYDLSRFGAVEL